MQFDILQNKRIIGALYCFCLLKRIFKVTLWSLAGTRIWSLGPDFFPPLLSQKTMMLQLTLSPPCPSYCTSNAQLAHYFDVLRTYLITFIWRKIDIFIIRNELMADSSSKFFSECYNLVLRRASCIFGKRSSGGAQLPATVEGQPYLPGAPSLLCKIQRDHPYMIHILV